MSKKKMSDIMAVGLETVEGFFRAGVMDKVTYREFKALALLSVSPLPATKIRKIRNAERASQATFAGALNTSLSTIQKWETGEKKPSGAALKLLHIVKEQGLEAVMYAGRPGDRPAAF